MAKPFVNPFVSGQFLELRVDALVSDGRGLGRHDGVVVLVEDALPGQLVRARVDAVRKSLAEAALVEVLERSPDEQEPPCPHAGRCGGCSWQSLAYGRQLAWKERIVHDALERVGKVACPPMLPILPSPSEWGYRNKMEFAFGVSGDGGKALEEFQKKEPDLILLDIMLPGIDGYELLDYIKTTQMPVIFITAMGTLDDKVKGLRAGADDYITKPFSMPVLLRKIAAVLRRSNRGTDEKYQVIAYSNLLLNCDSYTATVDGVTYELTQKEFEILRELLTHQGRILTRQNLLDKLWRYDFYGDERVVDTHIKNLRKKLGIDFIQTIRGVGYKVDKEN